MSNKELADNLNLSLDTVKMKIRKDNIKRKRFKEEISFIEDEEWRVIRFATNYSVSNKGRIKNNEGYLLQIYINNFGYCNVNIIDNKGNRKQYRLHRLVASEFIPNPYNKPEINHIDGNKQNNNINNLEWVTSSENKIHACENGLMSPPPLEIAIHTNNSEDVIKKVCIMLENGKKYDEILKETGINKNIISQIKRRITWKEISKNYKW